MEQQIRAGRSVTKRVQRDPRASADIKAKATELDQLLEVRERTMAKLETQYRDFLAQHKGELDELKRTSQQARTLAETLRSSYELDRRTRRQN